MKKLPLILALFLITMPFSQAVALGVNRAVINYRDVLRGGYAEDYAAATTDAGFPISVEHEFTGEVAEWFSLVDAGEELNFSRDKPLSFIIAVQPPEDAANGVYNAKLKLLTGAVSKSEGQYGSSIRTSFAIKLNVEITGEEVLSCTAGGFSFIDTETRDLLDFSATVRNTGNVQVQPSFTIDVWDQYQTQLVYSTQAISEENVLPTTQKSVFFNLEQELPVGQYWVTVREDTCGNANTLTFNVLEPGGISDRGELLRIDNEPWAGTEDIVRVAAIFKNTGSRTTEAKFKGTIELDGRVVEVIDTDILNVRPLQTVDFESFFNPPGAGRYEVKGRVIYNNKLTFERSSTITVKGIVEPRVTEGYLIFKNPYQIAMVFIFMAIIFLLFLIRKEKNKRRRW